MGSLANLDGGTHIVAVYPRVKRTVVEVRDVLDQAIVTRVGAGPFRAGNILRAEVFEDSLRDDRLLLMFTVDVGTSPSLQESLAAVEAVARVRIIARTLRSVRSAP